MDILQTRKEKLKKEAEMELKYQKQQEAQREEQRKRNEEEQQKKCENFLNGLKEMVKKEDIIAITTFEFPFKQLALKFLLTNGYTCVQNDVVATKYTVHYVLTFAKNEFACKFK